MKCSFLSTVVGFAAMLGLFVTSGLVKAQTVAVVDNNSPEPNIVHVKNFSTTISASVSGLPTPQAECQLTSNTPTWTWWVGQGFDYLGGSGPSIILLKDAVLGGGSTSVNVTATAHWTDDHGHEYTKDGTVRVTFFVLVPMKVVKNGDKTHVVIGAGHQDSYPLRCIDNQISAAAYSNGLIHETFSGIQDGNGQPIDPSTFNPGGPDTWTLSVDGNGFCTGTGTTGSDLTDTWATSSADSFDQPWFCWELQPSGTLYFPANQFQYHVNNPQNGDLNSGALSTSLNTHHGAETAANSLRSYPGQTGY